MFIVIDGPDGSGKTTLAKQLAGQLKQDGIPSLYTCEPTYDSQAGRKLRAMLQDGNILDLYAFADLFVEDRMEHLAAVIEPAIARGETVICDRYKYSSLVYQQLQGIDADYLVEGNRSCRVPDVIFVLLARNAEVLQQRIQDRGNERDIFEEREFLTRTLELYQKLPSYFPKERIVFLNAELPIEENIEKIRAALA